MNFEHVNLSQLVLVWLSGGIMGFGLCVVLILKMTQSVKRRGIIRAGELLAWVSPTNSLHVIIGDDSKLQKLEEAEPEKEP